MFNKYKAEIDCRRLLSDRTDLLYVAVVGVVPGPVRPVADVGGVVTEHCISGVHYHCVQRVLAVILEEQIKTWMREDTPRVDVFF